MTPDEMKAPCHLFNVHSHITYLATLAVIEREKLAPTDCVFLLTRGYRPPRQDHGIRCVEFPLEFLAWSFYYGNNTEEKRNNIHRLRGFIHDIFGGENFIFYVPQTYMFYVAVIASFDECVGYSLIEEGLASHNSYLYGGRFFRARKYVPETMEKCNDNRLLYFDFVFFNTAHPKYRNAYALTNGAFPGVPKRIMLKNWLKAGSISREDKKSLLLVFGGEVMYFNLCAANYLKVLDEFVSKWAIPGKYERIYYKLKVGFDNSNETMMLDALRKKYRGIEFVELPSECVLEEFVQEKDVCVASLISSVLLYAAAAGAEAVSWLPLLMTSTCDIRSIDELKSYETTLFKTDGIRMLPIRFDCDPHATAGKNKKKRVYSFDIFDTLLTRKTASPEGVFQIMQSKLARDFSKELPTSLICDFPRIRFECHKNAKRACKNEEVTLEEIFENIRHRFSLAQEQAERLLQLEIATELEVTAGITENIHKVHSLLAEGERVVLISDMYLPKKAILDLLRKSSPVIAEKCELYLSSDLKKKKGTGNLYRHVLDQEGISPKNLIHTGDNLVMDIQSARKLGITTIHYTKSGPGIYETPYYRKNALFPEICAGIAKEYRTRYPNLSDRQLLGACVAGPLLYGFVLDAMLQAKSKGIRRLYFVARDGHLLLQIAKRINQALSLDLDPRYLYASRIAFRYAAIFELETPELNWIFQKSLPVTVQCVADRIGMNTEKFLQFLPESEREFFAEVDKILDENAVGRLRGLFWKTPALRKEIQRLAKISRENLLGYLKGERFFDDTLVGLVDVGWTGRTLDMFYKIVSNHSPEHKMHTFYFGTIMPSLFSSPGNTRSAYAFSDLSHLKPKQPGEANPTGLIELLLMAPHPTTIGFEKTEKGFGPVFGKDNDISSVWNIREYQAAVCHFVDEMLPWQKACRFSRDDVKSTAIPLMDFLRHPDGAIGECLGGIPFSGDPHETGICEFAPPFDVKNAWRHALASGSTQDESFTQWPNVSLQRSSNAIRNFVFPLAFRIGKVLSYSNRKLPTVSNMTKRFISILVKALTVMVGLIAFPFLIAIKVAGYVLNSPLKLWNAIATSREFHVFNVHSHITFLVAMRIIEAKKLNKKRCVLFTSRTNYRTPETDVRVLEYPLPILVEKSAKDFFSMKKELDEFLKDLTRGKAFHFYCPHLRASFVRYFISKKQCLSYGFIEEGMHSINPLMADVAYVEDPEFDQYDEFKDFDKRYFFCGHKKYDGAYAIYEEAFRGFEKRVLLGSETFGHERRPEYEGADAMIVFSHSHAHRHMPRAKYDQMIHALITDHIRPRGIKRILVRTAQILVGLQGQTVEEQMGYFSKYPDIEAVLMDDQSVVENVLNTYKIPLFLFSSSVGFYAAKLGCPVYSYYDLPTLFASKSIEKLEAANNRIFTGYRGVFEKVGIRYLGKEPYRQSSPLPTTQPRKPNSTMQKKAPSMISAPFRALKRALVHTVKAVLRPFKHLVQWIVRVACAEQTRMLQGIFKEQRMFAKGNKKWNESILREIRNLRESNRQLSEEHAKLLHIVFKEQRMFAGGTKTWSEAILREIGKTVDRSEFEASMKILLDKAGQGRELSGIVAEMQRQTENAFSKLDEKQNFLTARLVDDHSAFEKSFEMIRNHWDTLDAQRKEDREFVETTNGDLMKKLDVQRQEDREFIVSTTEKLDALDVRRKEDRQFVETKTTTLAEKLDEMHSIRIQKESELQARFDEIGKEIRDRREEEFAARLLEAENRFELQKTTDIEKALAEQSESKEKVFAEKLKKENEVYHLNQMKKDFPSLGSRNMLNVQLPQSRFAFIMGCGFSGTTLLNRILREHPGIYAFNRSVMDGQVHATEESSLFDASRNPFVSDGATLSHLRMAENEAISRGKSLVLEKTPANLVHIDRINMFLPNARHICMIRDGRDVVAGWINLLDNLDEKQFIGKVKYWLEHVRLMENYLKRATNMKVVRLEDLTHSQENIIHDVLEYVDMPHSPELVDYMLRYQERIPKDQTVTTERVRTGDLKKGDTTERIFSVREIQLKQPIYQDTSRWRTDVPVEFWPLMYEKIGPTLERLGYVENAEQSLKEELERYHRELEAARHLEFQLEEKRRSLGWNGENPTSENAA